LLQQAAEQPVISVDTKKKKRYQEYTKKERGTD